MSVKRKISGRKIMQTVLTVVLGTACIMAITSATKMQKSKALKNLSISIKNDKYGFVTEDDIRDVLLNIYNDGDTVMLSELDVKKMERMVAGNPWVQDAEVYIDNNLTLHATVTQRVPVVRVFDKDGGTYYLDRSSSAMPTSLKYNHYTMVVTNAPSLLKEDSATNSIKSQILSVVNYIQKDTFWRAQVSQVIVRDDISFEIVPVLGNHKIIIGDTTNLDVKFNNLFAFYNNVLNEVGWDKYDELDLSYKGQLVASPGLDWNLPEDKVIRRINWVHSILGEEKKRVVLTNSVASSNDAQSQKQEYNTAKIEKEKQTIQNNSTITMTDPAPPQEAQTKQAQTTKTKNEEPVVKLKENKKKPKYIYNGNGD